MSQKKSETERSIKTVCACIQDSTSAALTLFFRGLSGASVNNTGCYTKTSNIHGHLQSTSNTTPLFNN